MEVPPPGRLSLLVAQVQDRAATDAPADLLDMAAAVSAESAADADRLLEHFVIHARTTGMSWTDIGTHLGVSKQAARQRFSSTISGPLPFAARTAPRLQACLDQAAHEARADGAAEIGTHHLLYGLLTEGVAAAILERVDVRPDAVRAASHRLFGPPVQATRAKTPSLSAEAACALDSAAHRAVTNAAPNETPEVRTEHVLAALALDPGGRARRVLNELHVDIAAIKRELQCYIAVGSPRPARWWKRRLPVQDGCSFCGRTAPAVTLVKGPGVAICHACVDISVDTLRSRRIPTEDRLGDQSQAD